jgi:hypothetical protein
MAARLRSQRDRYRRFQIDAEYVQAPTLRGDMCMVVSCQGSALWRGQFTGLPGLVVVV